MSRESTLVPIPLRAVTAERVGGRGAKVPAFVRPFQVHVWTPAARLRLVQIVRTSVVPQ
jgi:hypothetical protein